MGLLTLLFAFFETLGDTIKGKTENVRAAAERRYDENIDFNHIAAVTLDGVETAYRTETEEIFDPVSSQFLTEQDGWQHYETKTMEHTVEDGEDYYFTIRYKDGTLVRRKFHSSSPLVERLLQYIEG